MKGYRLFYDEDLVGFTCVIKFLKSRIIKWLSYLMHKGQKSTGMDVLGRVMIMYHSYSFGDWKHPD